MRHQAQRVKQYVPYSLWYGARKLYHEFYLPARYGAVARQDAAALAAFHMTVAPPPALRHRTHGAPDLASFLAVGRQLHTALDAGVQRLGGSLDDVRHVLDFGCGCGRAALFFRQSHPGLAYAGVDLDRECIAWLQGNLDWGAFEVNEPDPPLPFADAAFDLTFSISVFTHLAEGPADAWLRELRRVTRPGGYVLLSIHGEQYNTQLPPERRRELAERGVAWVGSGVPHRFAGAGYQNTYHTWRHIREVWGAHFTVVDRLGVGVQDLVLMRRPAEG